MILLFVLFFIAAFSFSFELDEGEQIQQARELVSALHATPQVSSADHEKINHDLSLRKQIYYKHSHPSYNNFGSKTKVKIGVSAYIMRQLNHLKSIECIHCCALCNINLVHNKKIKVYCSACKKCTIIYTL